MKKSLILLLVSLASTAAMAQLADLKVAIDPTFKPFTFKTADGKPTGFDVDIANALCEQLKRKCVFVEQVWDGMISGLQTKKYDVIISSMAMTEERSKVVDFSNKYYNMPIRLVTRNDIKVEDNFDGLKGKKIGVLKGSAQEKFAMGELKGRGANVVPYEATEQVYLDLKSGRLDGTVALSAEVDAGFLSKPEGKNYGFVGQSLNNQYSKYFGVGAGVAMRKGDKLKDEINAAISAIRANGTYKKINDKYFTIDIFGG